MDSLEDRLNKKIKSLNEILEKYNELNKMTHYRYDWRSKAIETQIQVLEELRDGQEDEGWIQCYNEDFKESKFDI